MVRLFARVVIAIVLLAPLRAAGQTTWFKFEGNPVLSVGPPGSWDALMVNVSRVIREGSLYRMWYLGVGNDGVPRSGHATSPDGITWARDPSNPILREGPPGSWESRGAFHPYVIPTDSGYQMWYMGLDNTSRYRIGFATSHDGIDWTKDTSNPVLEPGSWYDVGPTLPCVLEGFTGTYRMWFAGEGSGHYLQIGYADGRTPTEWIPRSSPVLPKGSPGDWDDRNVFGPRVLLDGKAGNYEMWYGGERSDFGSQFGYATSLDGLSWTKHPSNPVFLRGPAPWEANDIAQPQVLFDGSVYHMWYNGRGGSGWRVGYAISPKGFSVDVSPKRDSLDRNHDTVRVVVRVAGPSQLSFSVGIESPDENPVDTLRLFDDGTHGDSLASDGIYANSWIPGDGNAYYLDLMMSLRDSAKFVDMNNIKVFSPVTLVPSGETSVPREFFLGQNYPNPFNPSTTIRYGLPLRSHVTLTVFNTLGQQVATLIQGEQEGGFHEVRFEASNLSSGVYFYHLTAGSYVQTRKLLLLR